MKNNEPIDWDKVTVEGKEQPAAPAVEASVDAVDPAYAETVIAQNAEHQAAIEGEFDENAERASELGQAIKAAIESTPPDFKLAEVQARIAAQTERDDQMIGGMIRDTVNAEMANVPPDLGLEKVMARIHAEKATNAPVVQSETLKSYDDDGFEMSVNSFSPEQEDALKDFFGWDSNSQEFGAMSDVEKMNKVREVLLGEIDEFDQSANAESGFTSDEQQFNRIKDRYLSMKKAFSGFSLGKKLKVLKNGNIIRTLSL